ncbi:MAG: hypothetical protein ACK5W0_03095 [Labrys sp. (in: a-proteobacteria)]
MTKPSIPKPSRRFSRRSVIATFVLAWAVIVWPIYLGDADLVRAVIDPMVLLIAAVLGIYTGVGHMDLRVLAQRGSAPPPPTEPTE